MSTPRPPPSVDPMSGRLDPALCSTAALDAEPRKGTCKRPDNESLAGAIEPNCQRRHHGALARTVEPNCQWQHHGAHARTVEPNCQRRHHGALARTVEPNCQRQHHGAHAWANATSWRRPNEFHPEYAYVGQRAHEVFRLTATGLGPVPRLPDCWERPSPELLEPPGRHLRRVHRRLRKGRLHSGGSSDEGRGIVAADRCHHGVPLCRRSGDGASQRPGTLHL